MQKIKKIIFDRVVTFLFVLFMSISTYIVVKVLAGASI